MNLIARLAGLLAVTASCSAAAVPLLAEDFDDIAALPAKGWLLDNRSAPPGSTGWFQGNPAFFAAAAGAADSYIAANFNNAAYGGSVDNWLFTPRLLIENGEALNFSLRLLGEGALDRVEVYLDSGSAYTLLANFASAADTGWLDHTVLVSGLAAPASGRFGFRYVVDDTSLNGDYIGIDTVSVSAVPEPATLALLGFGVLALWRRQRIPPWRGWRAMAGLSALALAGPATAGPPAPSASDNGLMQFPYVSVVAEPAAAAAPTGQGGFMAYKDPLTGQLTAPDPGQAALLTATARAGAPIARQAPPQVAHAPHGGISLMLDERQARYATVRKAADGSVHRRCEPAPGAQR